MTNATTTKPLSTRNLKALTKAARELISDPRSTRELAAEFGCSEELVARIQAECS